MQMRRFLFAALWMWPSLASPQGSSLGAVSLGSNDQVLEGVVSLHPPVAANGTVVKINRRHIQESGCDSCLILPDSPAFLAVDQLIKGDLDHLPLEVRQNLPPNPPPLPPEGTRAQLFIQGGNALICSLDSEAPMTWACERRHEQLGVWQSIQERIDAAEAQGDADALLHLADVITTNDPSSAVSALLAAMDLGALPAAGSRASEVFMAQAKYPEAVAVLDRVIAAQGAAASPDLLARRETARAVSGLPFEASKVDLSRLPVNDIHLGPVSLRDHVLNDVVWRNAHLDGVDLSGLRTDGFEVDRGTMDHVSFHGAKATVAVPLSEEAAFGRNGIVVPPHWDGKAPAPTLESVIRNASGTAITAFSLEFTRSPFKIHALITDSNFSDASLPFAEINGSRAAYYGAVVTQRTTFERSNLEAADFGGRLEQITFKDAKLDWAEFTQATLDHVSFEGASLAGTEFSDVQFRAVDFSHAKTWESDPTVEGVLRHLDKSLVLDPILGLRFKPTMYGRSTYDCETKWPPGFDPAQYGLLPTNSSCVGRKALDFDDTTIPDLTVSKGTDLSGASFRGAHMGAVCRGGSLHGADFTDAVFDGTTDGCDLTDAFFDHATVTANLSGAMLTGAKFMDSTIDVEAVASFPFYRFWIHRPPDPSQRMFTDLPGAMFERSRLSCALPSFARSDAAFHDGNEERTVAALRKLQERGLAMDESCRKAFPSL